MKNLLFTSLAAFLGALLAVLLGGLVNSQPAETLGASGGITRFPNGGVVARYFKVSTSTAQTAGTDGTLNIGGGTDIKKYLCGTNTTFNPGALTSSTDSFATTSVTVADAAIGDVVLVTLSTSTSQDVWRVTGKVGTAGAVNVMFTVNAALDLTTTTAKACVIN